MIALGTGLTGCRIGGQLGYRVASLIAVGDSIVQGGVGGVPSFVDTIAETWGANLTNMATSGTILQNGNDAGGAPRSGNLMDNFEARSITPEAEAILCAYGFNDARYVGTDGTANGYGHTLGPAEFAADLRSCCRRWLPIFGRDNIWLMTPHHISDAGLTTGSTGFSGQTRAGFEAYVTACRGVASEFGARLVDSYAAGAPGSTVDNLHPDAAGRDDLIAAFTAATVTAPPPSIATLTGGAGEIIIPAGVEAYHVDGAAEVTLAVGPNAIAAGEQAIVWRTSGGRWEISRVLITEAPSALTLNTTPDDTLGWTVDAATSASCDMSGATTRNHRSWAANWPVGTRVTCDVTASGLRVLLRLNNIATLNGGENETLMDQTINGTVTLDVLTTQSEAYFGFLTLAPGDVVIDNFRVELG